MNYGGRKAITEYTNFVMAFFEPEAVLWQRVNSNYMSICTKNRGIIYLYVRTVYDIIIHYIYWICNAKLRG